VILVDNWSSDDSHSFVTIKFPKVKYILSKENLWFAWWNNLGISYAQGEFLLLLNNDTRMDQDFLDRYINSYQTLWYDILWVSEKPYDPWQTKKSSTISLTIDWFWHPFVDRKSKKLFYTNGACLLCKKVIYIKSWGLDSNFFMYCEEVDWQWRSRLYWYSIGKSNDLHIYHAGAWSSNSRGLNYNTFLRRNQNTPQMLIKNYSRQYLCWIIPGYITINIVEMIAFLLAWKWMIAYSYLQWRWFVIMSLHKSILPQRKIIQTKRVVSDSEIMKMMYHWSAKIHHLYSFLQKK
jgi:GT2 family glycosyltransferase